MGHLSHILGCNYASPLSHILGCNYASPLSHILGCNYTSPLSHILGCNYVGPLSHILGCNFFYMCTITKMPCYSGNMAKQRNCSLGQISFLSNLHYHRF